jgi:hypothetical protein
MRRILGSLDEAAAGAVGTFSAELDANLIFNV